MRPVDLAHRVAAVYRGRPWPRWLRLTVLAAGAALVAPWLLAAWLWWAWLAMRAFGHSGGLIEFAAPRLG